MRRRTFLTGTTLGAISGAGCLSDLGGGCPDPNIENGLSYESHNPSGPLFDAAEEGAFLVTGPDEVDRFDSRYFEDEDEQWAKDTDFEEAVVLGIQIGSSGESSPLEVLGIGREAAETVHAYTCIERQGRTDDWAPYTRLLRISHGGQVPEAATLTHWEDGDRQIFE